MIDVDSEMLMTLVRDVEAITPDDGEWHGFVPWPMLNFMHGDTGCTRLLYTTKLSGLIGIHFGEDVVTKGAAIFSRSGLVTPVYASCVATEAMRCNAEIVFVGDLDPLDLTVFLSLAVGLKTHGLSVRYVGVNDEWLELGRDYKPKMDPMIPLNQFEQKHLKLLERLPVKWEKLVGVESMALLHSGKKLELEGATNPHLYESGIKGKIESLIFHGR